jgi:kynurenine formamidase
MEMDMNRGRVMACVMAGLMAACGSPPAPGGLPDGDLVDLSHGYGDDTIFWPTADPFTLERVADGITDLGYYYAANVFRTAEHGGTHVDAPIHFGQGRPTVDAIPLDRLVGAALVVDVAAKAEADADYEVNVDDFEAWERIHGEIPPGSMVLIRTGYSQRWPDAERYLGTALRGAEGAAQLRFPGLHADAARWLATSRQIGAVGIDTASIDRGQSTLFESHRILAEQEIPAFENLTALERLPATGSLLFALPMKISGGSGAPLRAVALVPRD